MSAKNQHTFAYVMITSLFFLWGFVHNLDPILIPHLKKSFSLTTLQSSLVDSSVFIAYFLMALPAGVVMKKYGYKNGILLGLLLFAIGSYLFIPAANLQSYGFFLMALFIIACGLTILETAANPYASLLGPKETSTQRLNFSQAFNGLAATLAPILGARIILTENFSEEELARMSEAARTLALSSEAASVKLPYLILGSLIVLIAVIFYFLKLPEIVTGSKETQNIKTVLQHRHLRHAVIAQFFYVGAQICLFSFFLLYATKAASINRIKAADYLGWGCGMAFMIGRFIGTFLMNYLTAERLLTLYSLICFALSLAAIHASGMITIYIVISISFFMSIMFPTIFSLGIRDLGNDTAMGSSLLIMSIVGGAILPPCFGYLSDVTEDIQQGYWIMALSFAVIAWFGWNGYKTYKTQPS